MDHKSTDEQLLKRIQEDDETAFQNLFDKYYKTLCYAAYKIYPDEHKSKDFSQEVFLDIWKKRKTLSIHTSLNAFLRRAVTNKAIDYIRAQRFNFEDPPPSDKDQIQPFEAIEQAELKSLIHRTAEQLPERCRLVFFMSRFEELSHKEIAAKLDISEKTVENQITKALKRLRIVVTHYLSESKLILHFLFFS